ncbi:MAG TPA: phosphatase PAP2 family protein [Candidatus Limnocylindrales bacterium]
MSDEVGAAPIPEPVALGRRNDRLLLVAVVGYVVLLSALMIVRGVSVTPDVLLVALGMAAVLLGRGRLFFRDWIPFIGLFFAYELMRGYADNAGLPIHAADVIAAERIVFLGHVPTEVLQSWLHPATGFDPWAMASVVFYFLHFPLPIAVGFVLWLRRRPVYYDYVGALIVLAMAGFVTYLLLPVAPPWWAHEHGLLDGIAKLRDQGFAELASVAGFDQAGYVYSYTFYDINPNEVAAFPSLHAAFPFLAFLFARRTFGRVGWVMLAYTACIVFAIVYLGEHYVIDAIAGVAYAYAAYWLVVRGPAWIGRLVDRFEDSGLDAEATAAAEGQPGAFGRTWTTIRWDQVGQGLALAIAGVIGIVAMAKGGLLGGTGSPIYLVPWALVLAGLWRGALGLLAR